MISDIFSPFSGRGYNVEHPGVKRQPIGSLNSRYLRRNARTVPEEKPTVADAPSYTFVPPLKSLHQEEETRPTYSRRLKLAVPILLLAIALIWLLSLHQPAKTNHGIGAQTIPIIQTVSSGSGNTGSGNGGSGSSQASPGNASTASTPNISEGSSSGLGVPTGGVTGGRGGVGSGSSGTLPLTLTVPPTNISGDGKQVLDSGGTTITVN